MRPLFGGYLVSESQTTELSGASVAANRMQVGLVNALTPQPQGNVVEVVTVYHIAPFPGDSTLWIRNEVLDGGNSRLAERVRALSVPIVKQVAQALGLLRRGARLVRTNHYDFLLSCNMNPQVGVPACRIGRRFRVPVLSLPAASLIDPQPNRRAPSRQLFQARTGMTERLIRMCAVVIVSNTCAEERYAPHLGRLAIDGGVDGDPATARRDLDGAWRSEACGFHWGPDRTHHHSNRDRQGQGVCLRSKRTQRLARPCVKAGS